MTPTIENDFKNKVMGIMRDDIHFSGQVNGYVVHGAVDKIWQLAASLNQCSGWVVSNERLPDNHKFYYAEDTIGQRTMIIFDGHWHSLTGHPVAKWYDESSPCQHKKEVEEKLTQSEQRVKELEGDVLGLQNEIERDSAKAKNKIAELERDLNYFHERGEINP